MEEQLISIETGRLASERGFAIKGNQAAYLMNKPEALDLPTQSLLQKWLREIHKIDVLPLLRYTGKYGVDVYHYDEPNLEGRRTRYNNLTSYGTYEEALEEALQEGLKLIK